MNKLEKALIGVFLSSITLNILNVVGVWVITLSSVLIGNFYFFFGLLIMNGIKPLRVLHSDSYSGISGLRKIGSILFGVNISFLIIGIMSKLMLYTVIDNMFLNLGLFGCLIALLVGIVRNNKHPNKFYKSLFIRIGFFGLLALSFRLIPDDLMLSNRYPDNPEYVKAVNELNQNPTDTNIRKVVMEEWDKMNYPN